MSRPVQDEVSAKIAVKAYNAMPEASSDDVRNMLVTSVWGPMWFMIERQVRSKLKDKMWSKKR